MKLRERGRIFGDYFERSHIDKLLTIKYNDITKIDKYLTLMI